MWSDVQESEPSASWLDLPENGWGRSSAGQPAWTTYAAARPRMQAGPSPVTSSAGASNNPSRNRSQLPTGRELTMTSTATPGMPASRRGRGATSG